MRYTSRGSPVLPAAAGTIPNPTATNFDLISTPGSNATATGTETRSAEPDRRRTYSCTACHHVLRVTGLGRHTVYFELTNERLDDPVTNRVCPACGHGLPGK